jgi:hypothetical protein
MVTIITTPIIYLYFKDDEHRMYMYRKPRSLVVRFMDAYILMVVFFSENLFI